jgi:hypothetical protein
VDTDHPVPCLVGHLLGDVPVGLQGLSTQHLAEPGFRFAAHRLALGPPRPDARVVDEHVQRSQLALDLGEHRAHLSAVRHVRGDGPPPAARELAGGGLGGVAVHIVDDDPRSFFGEEHGDGLADPGACARDERHPILQLHA